LLDDENGRIDIDGVSDDACDVFVTTRGDVRTRRVVVRDVRVGDDVVPIVFGPSSTIEGRVVNEIGAPVAGLSVRAERRGAARWASRFARTDALGQFVIDDVEAGSHDLSVEWDREKLLHRLVSPVAAAAGSVDVVLVATLAARIAGVVRDAAGGAVAGRRLMLLHVSGDASPRLALSVVSDATGRFEFTGVPPESVWRVVPDLGSGAEDIRHAEAAAKEARAGASDVQIAVPSER
jgi:hypothetical protein